MKRRIGIDLGGTKTEIMLTEENPLDIIERRRVPTSQENGYEFIINQTAELIKNYLKLCDSEPVIGMGIPGSINVKSQLVRNSNTLCLNGMPLKKDLESLIQIPITVENDANCLTLSEALLGAGKDYEMVLGIIMGTGMGGGLVVNGKIWNGQHGIAGEFGHTSIDRFGRDCWCGEKGCLERYISGTAVEAHYKALSDDKLKLPEIYQRYLDKSDNAAIEAIEELISAFGRGIANFITAFDPNIVIIGGGVSNLPILYSEGVKAIKKQIFCDDELTTPVVQNKLGDSSGIFGAALLA